MSVLLGLVVGVLSIGFMPFIFAHVGAGMVLPTLILLCMSTRPRQGLVFALVTGAVLDSYAFYAFELHTLRLLILVWLTTFLFSRWLTNRSVYTAVALVVVVTILNQLCELGLASWHSQTGLASFSWASGVWVLGLHILLTILGFTFLSFFTAHVRLIGQPQAAKAWYG